MSINIFSYGKAIAQGLDCESGGLTRFCYKGMSVGIIKYMKPLKVCDGSPSSPVCWPWCLKLSLSMTWLFPKIAKKSKTSVFVFLRLVIKLSCGFEEVMNFKQSSCYTRNRLRLEDNRAALEDAKGFR